jgi:hypothetical protein
VTSFRSRFTAAVIVTALTPVACWLLAQPAAAQASHAYASLGGGATDLSGGVAWSLPNTRLAVGGEFGLGQLFWMSLTTSFDLFSRTIQPRIQPFASASVTVIGSSPYEATGISLGGGVAWWPWSQLGFRTEALKFWPAFSERVAPHDPVTPPFEPRLWAVRGGVTFRW